MALILPAGITLKRDKKSEQLLLDVSRKWLESEKRSPGIHASGLLDPRRTYWQTVDPQPIPDRMVTIFLIGKLLHAFVLSALAGAKGVDWSTDTGSKSSKRLKIEYSMDYVHEGIPTELKTSRSFFEPTHVDDIGNYVEQVLIYQVAEDSLVGNIWVLYLNFKNKDKQTEPAYRCYKVSMTAEDKAAFEKQLIATRKGLEKALKTKNPKPLPLCRPWICGEKMCQWWKKCQPEGRYGLDKKHWTA
jgi:hypothetical protein